MRNERFTYAYFGSIYGSFREYPAVGGTCSDYDPRFRPWYIKATTAPKNIILLVDISATLDDSNKLNLLRATVTTLARKFSSVEHVSLITFNGTLNEITTAMEPATEDFIEDLKDIASSLEVSGTPNYVEAFGAAVAQLNSANSDSNDDEGTTCDPSQNVILFVSDAKDDSFNATAVEE